MAYLVLVDGLELYLDRNVYDIFLNNKNNIVNILGDDIDTDLDQNIITTGIDYSDIDLSSFSDDISVEVQCGATLIPRDELVEKVTGENIGGFRALVTNSSGEILHATIALVEEGRGVMGVSTQASSIGTSCTIGVDGDEITEPSWDWTIDEPIYSIENGVLTQEVPQTNYLQVVAIPLNPTTIAIRIEPPIFF